MSAAEETHAREVESTRVSGGNPRARVLLRWEHCFAHEAEDARHLYDDRSRCTGAPDFAATHLQPIRDFTIQPILSTTPPITFTMLVILTAAQVTKISAVPDTTIER